MSDLEVYNKSIREKIDDKYLDVIHDESDSDEI